MKHITVSALLNEYSFFMIVDALKRSKLELVGCNFDLGNYRKLKTIYIF